MKRLLAILVSLVLAACGGGGGGTDSSGTSPKPPLAANSVAVAVESFSAASNVNLPYVSVTVCVPGSQTCKTVDHVLVDTGSTGLRLVASALNGLALPPQTVGNSSTILECARFLSFYIWGPVRLADVVIGGKRASALPVQMAGEPLYATAPSSCGSAAMAAKAATDLGANGILGVGPFASDGQVYYNCVPTSRFNSCRVSPTPDQQVQNPVSLFVGDNNGVVLQLPAVAATGAARADGLMVFGIDTQDNNRLGSAKVIQTNSSGYFTTVYKGVALPSSFIDSGSNGLYFDDATLTPCPAPWEGFYCPTADRSLSASISLVNGGSDTLAFGIGNASNLLSANVYALANLGGPLSNAGMFDWGLPFFFGRSVYTVIEGRSTSAGVGPFFAYTN
ncbi:MAG: DUF3443 domain-containing protein [Rhodoferax sp.]